MSQFPAPGGLLPPPVAMALTGNDRGLITAFNSVAGVTVSIFGRVLGTDGKLHEIQQDFAPAATRAAVTQSWEPGDGFLLSLMVTVSGTVKRGQCYVRVDLQRGLQTAPLIYDTLIADYVYTGYRPFWPFGRTSPPTEGPGMLRSIQVTNPAAGADWNQTVPTGARWRVLTGNFLFTASAAVANRFPAIIFDDGVNELYATAWDNAVTAGTAPRVSLGPQRYVATNDGNSQAIAYIGNLALFAGWRVRSLTTAIQAADQWSAINLLVEEWIEP